MAPRVSSGGTCYEKLSLVGTCLVLVFRLQIMLDFELGNQETHNMIEHVYIGFKG